MENIVNKSWLNPKWVARGSTDDSKVDLFGAIEEPDFAQLLMFNDDTPGICANWLSEEVAKIKLRIYTNKDKASSPLTKLKFVSKGLSEVVQHPIRNLLDNPNKHQSTHGFLKTIDMQLSFTGNSIVHKVREETWEERVNNQIHHKAEGLPIALVPLQVQHVKLAYTKENDVVGIWYSPGTTPVFYSFDDLIWFKLEGNPQNPFGFGRGPARIAYERIMIAKNEMAYLNTLYRNQARPDSIAVLKNSTWDQCETFEKQMWQRFQGGGGHGIWAVPDDVGELKPLGWSPKDVLGTELYKWIKLQIINAWKLNPAVLDQESSNRAVAEVAYRQAQQYAILPRLRLIEERLTQCLLRKDFDGSLEARFDSPVLEDRDFELQRDQAMVDRKAMSLNEWRQKNGMAPLPEEEDLSKKDDNQLRATVGGSQQIMLLQQAVYSGTMPRAAAIANAKTVFGFSENEAAALFPVIPGFHAQPAQEQPQVQKCGGEGGNPGPCPDSGAEPEHHQGGKEHPAETWAGWAKQLPAKIYAKAKEKVANTYSKLEKRDGPKTAVAILGSGLAGVPLPVPGASLVTAAPAILVGELIRRYGSAKSEVTLSEEEIRQLGQEVLEELLAEWKGEISMEENK